MEIRSVDLIDFKITLSTWIKEQPLPMELKRMLVNEVANDISQLALDEIKTQIEEREEKENAESDSEHLQ